MALDEALGVQACLRHGTRTENNSPAGMRHRRPAAARGVFQIEVIEFI